MVAIYALAQRRGDRWAGPLLIALYVAPILVLLFRQHFLVPAMLAACLWLWVATRRDHAHLQGEGA
jgi:hypothetical protein